MKSHLSSAEIDKLFIPLTYQGSAQIFIDRLVVASQSRATAPAPKPEPIEPKLPSRRS